jgi:putative transposase
MANTYSQIYLHFVFCPKNRNALISKSLKPQLEKYITEVVQNNKHKMLQINCQIDHIHFAIGYNVNQLISDLIENIKTSTNNWIKENKLSKYKFEWQKGYGVFSNSHSQLNSVINYIMNQDLQHKKSSFKDEYLEMLNKYNIAFENKYVFDFFENLDEE